MNTLDNMHLGIIMDGNGRWATEKRKSRSSGHVAGVYTIRKIVEKCLELNIKSLSLYAFSTENWKRPKKEVEFLFRLLNHYLDENTISLHEKGIRILHSGDRKNLDVYLLKKLDSAIELTKENSRLNLNLCINYGGRMEILDSIQKFFEVNKRLPNSEQEISENLYHPELPHLDLMIRTGGERRISNFLLWQMAYSELYFSDKFWPDFSSKDLEEAVFWFTGRQRRFGGISA